MKNRLLLVLVIVSTLFAFPVYAANKNNLVDLSNQFTGTLYLDPAGTKGNQPDLNPSYKPAGLNYVRHTMYFEGGGISGKAYCVYPGLHAGKQNTVVCGTVSPKTFSFTYYIIYHYWDVLKNNDELADFVLRTAGWTDTQMIDIFDIYHQCVRECNGEQNRECILSCQGREEKKQNAGFSNCVGENCEYGTAFYNTFACYGFGDPGACADQAHLFIDKNGDGVVARGKQMFQEAWAAKGEVEKWTLPSDYGKAAAEGDKIIGDKFWIQKLDTREARVAYYEFGTNDGSNVGEIRIKGLDNTKVQVTSWDGTYGVFRAEANADCLGKVKIEIGGGGGNTIIPSGPTPRDNDKCPNNAPYRCAIKTPKKVKNYDDCTWVPPIEKSEGRAGRPGYYTPDGCIKEVDSQTEFNIKYITSCTQNSSCPSGSYSVMLADATNKGEIEVNGDYATEKSELVFDNKIATEQPEEYNTENLSIIDERRDITMYYCEIAGQNNSQSYVVIKEGEIHKDEFNLDISCEVCCDYVNNSKDMKITDIHNCCEEGLESFARQAALDELFCKDPGLKVNGYMPKCNSDSYDVTDVNMYCKQYCSETIQYRIPPPTRAKADAYFWFAKNNNKNDGSEFTGPIFQKYKRCRTTIAYDKFNKDYSEIATKINDSYTDYQKSAAYEALWVKLQEKASSSAATATSDAKKTLDDVGISCTYTITYKYWVDDGYWDPSTYSCGTPRNPTTCKCSETEDTAHCTWKDTSHWSTGHEKEFTGASGTVSGDTVRVYDESIESKNFPYASYGTASGNWAPKLINAKNPINKSGYWYDKNDVDSFKNKVSSKKSELYDEAVEDLKKSEHWDYCEGKDCETTNRSGVSCTGDVGIDDNSTTTASSMISALSQAAGAKASVYRSYVDKLKEIQNMHVQCGGAFTLDANNHEHVNTETIKNRISFEKEPNLEFHYYQEYIDGDDKEIKGQLLQVPFYYANKDGSEATAVDGKYCVYETRSSLDADASKDWDRFDDMTGWKDDNYSDLDIGMKHLNMYNYSEQVTYQALNNTSYTGAGGVYVADRKYTTDAVSHMTCRWSDNKDNKIYNIIPNGIVIKDYEAKEEEIKKLDRKYVCRSGTYGIMKTAREGKMEIYYTLYDIGDPFDDIVHAASPSCSGSTNLYVNDKPTNLTCNIEIKTNGWYIYNCPPGCPTECCQATEKTCGVGGNCISQCECMKQVQTIEYKEVDASNLFPNLEQYKDKPGYAWNWTTGPNGKETYEKIETTAAEDKTYSKDNLTYSFTLTPTDIKAIRAYNKAQIKSGGYGDFNMNCEEYKEGICGYEATPLENCTSNFLTAISGGNGGMPYPDKSGTLNLDTDNIPIQTSREKYKSKSN